MLDWGLLRRVHRFRLGVFDKSLKTDDADELVLVETLPEVGKHLTSGWKDGTIPETFDRDDDSGGCIGVDVGDFPRGATAGGVLTHDVVVQAGCALCKGFNNAHVVDVASGGVRDLKLFDKLVDGHAVLDGGLETKDRVAVPEVVHFNVSRVDHEPVLYRLADIRHTGVHQPIENVLHRTKEFRDAGVDKTGLVVKELRRVVEELVVVVTHVGLDADDTTIVRDPDKDDDVLVEVRVQRGVVVDEDFGRVATVFDFGYKDEMCFGVWVDRGVETGGGFLNDRSPTTIHVDVIGHLWDEFDTGDDAVTFHLRESVTRVVVLVSAEFAVTVASERDTNVRKPTVRIYHLDLVAKVLGDAGPLFDQRWLLLRRE